ncbi:MAG: carbamoyl-phosphate synthase large subunit [Candidatus Gracilibacteria bacterium]|jgi:carbamoyl-phosphate synthase large subunit|nr:carbamoyl-phosphate synthase large subunit [Candidatus Gracilibacteria bacterium]
MQIYFKKLFYKKRVKKDIKKVLLLGSGALKIGEAGEFDFSGSQAIKALKQENIEVVLLNPNIATNQTSKGVADKVYFLPVNAKFAEQVIEKERPDGILLAWGGQTALNCGMELHDKGVLEKYNVEVLGTPVDVIKKTEDRELFRDALDEIGVKTARSIACSNKKEALVASEKIGFPLIIRSGYTLGGGGSGFAQNTEEFKELIEKAFAHAPQILVEESIKGWKEIEFEVVRDADGNKITVCNMENFDPMGIHTGESIVVAPTITLSDRDWQMLRSIALKTIEHLGIVGECNIQYALDPNSNDYRVIEVNARLSRSSALASKATGYPLAYIACHIAMGKRLHELKNSITQKTSAFFEPALDFIALKMPRWDLDKFRKVSHEISSEMKSVGEIMALGRSFEEVLQKGLRMLQIGAHGITHHPFTINDIEKNLKNPTPRRIFAVYEALKQGYSVEKISKITGIDEWFIYKIENIKKTEDKLDKYFKNEVGDFGELLREAKMNGFSDAQIEKISNGKYTEMEIRKIRKEKGIIPCVKQIDTLAGEFPAETNYLYMSYHGSKSDV